MRPVDPTRAFKNKGNAAKLSCVHCDGPSILPVYEESSDPAHERPFCCHGCLTVYHVLLSKGLEDYYAIKQKAGSYRTRAPVDPQNGHYVYLDDKEFLSEYSYKNNHKQPVMEFYLEGIHCLACLWLVERLPFLLTGVISSKLDMEKSVVTVVLDRSAFETKTASFAAVAREFNQLGYRPHPLKRNQDVHDLQLKEERQALLRIGVAAAGASNVMLYAVSLYAGASEGYARLFAILSAAFALPVLTYSARPFYQSAWQAIKNKTLSIDVPISLSLLIGSGLGFYHLWRGSSHSYFDSLTMLVFLLLLSRYFLRKIQQKALSAQDLHFFYQGESVHRSVNGSLENFTEIHPKFIAMHDWIRVDPGEFIPADGRILQGKSHLNTSLLTGESLPLSVDVGDWVFAGTQNLSTPLVMKVFKIKNETRLGEILKSVESGWSARAPVVELTDQISKYFIFAVFLLATTLFCYRWWQGNDLSYAIEQALILLIVTCPCALALAVPLSFTRALNQAAQHGLMIKSDAVLQKLNDIRTIFIDKTGTLTYGKLRVLKYELINSPLQFPLWDIVSSLEFFSRHPVGVALAKHASQQGGQQKLVQNFLERPGRGVEGTIDGHHYQIDRTGLWEEGELKATFQLEDTLREDAASSLASLKKLGLSLKLLSGDSALAVQQISAQLGIPLQDAYPTLSPEDKKRIISETPHALMVGDGANDAIALTQADVGVAVMGAMDISLRAADVYFSLPGLSNVRKLFVLARESMKVIKRNLILSLLYNSLSVAAAFVGWITPLSAAIIMPLSSVTVLLSTVYGTKELRNLWK